MSSGEVEFGKVQSIHRIRLWPTCPTGPSSRPPPSSSWERSTRSYTAPISTHSNHSSHSSPTRSPHPITLSPNPTPSTPSLSNARGAGHPQPSSSSTSPAPPVAHTKWRVVRYFICTTIWYYSPAGSLAPPSLNASSCF